MESAGPSADDARDAIPVDPRTRPGNPIVASLGIAARAARALGLGRPLRAALPLLDAPFLLSGRPPLRNDIAGLTFRGYLRHRNFLVNEVRPETSYFELFIRSLRRGLTVVDGGAHIGAYTVLASRAVGPGPVFAFEPDPYNFRALRVNVGRLSGRNVRLSNRALSDRAGTASFHLSSGTIGSSFYERVDTAAAVTVETTTIDAELANVSLEGGLLVKLNVEGAEPLVLRGMRRTLERVERVTIFAEVHSQLLAQAGFEPSELLADLRALGFRTSWIDLTAHRHLICVRG